MEDNNNAFTLPSISGERKQPIALIASLLQNIGSMQHTDEVFLWLSKAMVQSLDIPVVQFWATQLDNIGRFHAEICAVFSQPPSIPQPMHVNQGVRGAIERLFYEQQNTTSVAVEDIFSPVEASLVTQCNLFYWAGYFLQNDVPFSPASGELVRMSPRFTVIVSLFTQTPLSTDQARAVDFTLKQAMRIIKSRDFVGLDTLEASRQTSAQNVAFWAIIPRRPQNIEQFQVSNPFTNASIIANKNARRLYDAIDGRKNIAELAQNTHFGQKELIESLRYLLQQKKIEFYTPDGEHMKHAPFISLLS